MSMLVLRTSCHNLWRSAGGLRISFMPTTKDWRRVQMKSARGPGKVFRDLDWHSAFDGELVGAITDRNLSDFVQRHAAVAPVPAPALTSADRNALHPMFLRIGLSCLVDADHFDTARNYRTETASPEVPLRPMDRLALLDAHVKFLGASSKSDRNAVRAAVYETCRNAKVGGGLIACDSPVGTGKTTAIMVHLLRTASEKLPQLRRIFIVLPFTNIIDQSVDVYRRALVGLGENSDEVVAAHYHRAEFANIELRQHTYRWNAPIIVTTAVQFFQTLASNRPELRCESYTRCRGRRSSSTKHTRHCPRIFGRKLGNGSTICNGNGRATSSWVPDR